jgi:hypothetical protein
MKKTKVILSAIACVSITAASSGCGMIRNLNEMHDATESMNDKMDHTNTAIDHTNNSVDTTNTTANHMAHTTDGMAQDVATTACVAGETYTALRQGNTLQARVGEDALGGMDSGHAIEDKIFHAGAYMKAFEFQIWNCADPDSAAYLKIFYRQAAEEFTRVLPNYLTTDKTKWSVSPIATDNKSNDLYAIAVSLQELNANIVEAYRLSDSKGKGKWDQQPQSMLDLIETSLTRKVEIAAHPERATLADREFLFNEDLMVQLFQIRMNFLAAMALAKVSNLEEKGFLGLPGLVREAKMLLGRGWEPNLHEFSSNDDLERLKYITRFLYGSNDIRAYMRSIGVTPMLDNTIFKMYSHMRTGDAVQPKIANPKTDQDLAFNNTQDAMAKYLEQLDIFFGRKAFTKIPELDHPEFFND